ncbi:MAG: AI-2E family transporter [Faecalibacterium sp.]|nr:AI-2E family transporter [Faecalibacterium sp.]
MFDEEERYRKIARLGLRVIVAGVLFYLAAGNLNVIANAIQYLFRISQPLWIGVILAMILNVPAGAIEAFLQKHCKWLCSAAAHRNWSIALALLAILGLFVGIAVLVIPELIDAVKLILQIMLGGLDNLAQLDQTIDYTQLPLGEYLASMDIDWTMLRTSLEKWTQAQAKSMADGVPAVLSSLAGNIITIFVALVFAIYVLAKKEVLMRQMRRLLRAWLPDRFTQPLCRVASVCSRTFQLYIGGQAIEAIILGSLCCVGMLILRIPYAPMISALIGVTALLPLVGAYIGAIVGAVMILTVDPVKMIVFLIFLVILQQLEGNLIYPRVVGSRVNLPAMWVLAAVTIGGNVAGILGMLLGVPLAAASYSLLREATVKREDAT